MSRDSILFNSSQMPTIGVEVELQILDNKTFDLLVSSAAIRLTELRVLTALKVISSKFPIGVETINKVPILLLRNLYIFQTLFNCFYSNI